MFIRQQEKIIGKAEKSMCYASKKLGILQFKTLGKEEQIKPRETGGKHIHKSRN